MLDLVASISGLKAFDTSNLTTGDTLIVSGYYTEGDGGGGEFYWDSTSTDADNGGTIIIPNGFSGPGRWLRKIDKKVNVRWFGAKGDDISDDITAIQSTIDFAGVGGIVYFSKGIYLITEDIKFLSGQEIYGEGYQSRIKQTGNFPCLTSKNYYSSSGASASGRCYIHHLVLDGNSQNNSNADGIRLRDYYTTIDNLRIENVGGHGIFFTVNDDLGNPTSGTLVENKVTNCFVFQPVGIPYYLGEQSNNKLTDGILQNCYSITTLTSPHSVYIGSSAGWFIENVHTYGAHTKNTPFVAANAFYTNVNNLYIEREGQNQVALGFPSIQKGLNLNNIAIRYESSIDGTAIELSKININPPPNPPDIAHININNLYIENRNTATVVCVKNATSDIITNISNLTKENFSTGAFIDYTNFSNSIVNYASLRESLNQIVLKFNDLGMAFQSYNEWSGADPVQIDINLGRIINYNGIVGTLHIISSANYNAVKRANASYRIYVSAKDNSADNWVVYSDAIISPSGFDTNPTFSSTHVSGSDTGDLRVDFEATDSDAYGKVVFVWGGPE